MKKFFTIQKGKRGKMIEKEKKRKQKKEKIPWFKREAFKLPRINFSKWLRREAFKLPRIDFSKSKSPISKIKERKRTIGSSILVFAIIVSISFGISQFVKARSIENLTQLEEARQEEQTTTEPTTEPKVPLTDRAVDNPPSEVAPSVAPSAEKSPLAPPLVVKPPPVATTRAPESAVSPKPTTQNSLNDENLTPADHGYRGTIE